MNPLRLLLLATIPLSGCAAHPATLTLHSGKTETTYSQSFHQAFCGSREDGTDEFILLADDAQQRQPRERAAGGPLKPVTQAPLRQVVYVRVFWRPMAAAMQDAPEQTNASIDWYVFNDSTDASEDLLHYQGAGLAHVRREKNLTMLDLRHASMKPRATRGRLSDSVGGATIRGKAAAVTDPGRLRAILATTRDRAANGTQARR